LIAVSVIIPVYNSEKYITDCVSSILHEDFADFEILLIDDGSTDKSPEICHELKKKDSRIKVFHKKNGGISDARNFGLAQAKGKYIAFCDHDDSVYKGFLKDNFQYAEKTNADIVKFGRDAFVVCKNGSYLDNTRRFSAKVFTKSHIQKRFLRFRINTTLNCVWDGLFKRSFLEENNIRFDTGYKTGCEDTDFCSVCFTKASIVAFSDKVYYKHIIRAGYSTSAKTDISKLTAFKMLADNLDCCVEQLGINRDKNLLYFIIVMQESIVPTFEFFAKMQFGFKETKKYINDNFSDYRRFIPNLRELLRLKNKWSIIYILFKLKMYSVIYFLFKIRSKTSRAEKL